MNISECSVISYVLSFIPCKMLIEHSLTGKPNKWLAEGGFKIIEQKNY